MKARVKSVQGTRVELAGDDGTTFVATVTPIIAEVAARSLGEQVDVSITEDEVTFALPMLEEDGFTERPTTLDQALGNLTAENWHSERALIEDALAELRQIEGCLVDPVERRPGRTYERVQELLAELRAVYGRLEDANGP